MCRPIKEEINIWLIVETRVCLIESIKTLTNNISCIFNNIKTGFVSTFLI